MSESVAVSENISLHISRVIKAKRSQVFDSWIKPELLMRWFGPGQMLPTEVVMDARQDGEFRFVIEGNSPRTGQPMSITFTGVFREFVDGERLGFDWTVAGDPGDPTYVTVKFRDVAEGTEVTLTQQRIPNADVYNRNQMGWSMMLEKLAGVSEMALRSEAENKRS